jgi:hypothetical protein
MTDRPRLGHAPREKNYLGGEDGPGDGWLDYDFAVVRAVPHVHLDTHVNVGVVVHGRTVEFLQARTLKDPSALEKAVPGADTAVLASYLASYEGIARGDAGHGPVALAPTSERFHWLTAPRSDVIQCSRVHSGRSRDLDATIDQLFRQYVPFPD